MAEASETLGSIRFGRFDLSVEAGELRKDGVRLKLSGQAIEVLLLLIASPGKLVAREELQRKLWPGASYGDPEHGLNAAVNRLRETLGDSATEPKYIETVPGRGYRFIAPVDGHGNPASTQTEQISRAGMMASWSPAKTVGLVLGILASVLVLLIALDVGGLRDRFLGRAKIRSLAVLPVKSYSADPAQELFADGMTDTLIAGLAQIKAIKVISRTSAMHYKGTSETVPQIARELEVDGILEASVTRSGDRVRLTAQLIDARDRHLWERSYERQMTDVLVLQSELVQVIAREIRANLTPQESERLKVTRRVDPEAYDAALQGKMILEYAGREEQFRQAIELFQKAVDRDPTYAPAWAGLGEALWNLAGSVTGGEWVAPAEVRDKAIAAADRALELDPNLAEAHKARAVIATDGEWDFDKAEQHFKRAIELQPGYAAAHLAYAVLLFVPLQRFDEARQHFDRARELDPFQPWNDVLLLSWWHFQGQYEKVLEEGAAAVKRDPTFCSGCAHGLMGSSLTMLGRLGEAATEYETGEVKSGLGLVYGLMGRKADALKILAELERASQKGYVPPTEIAMVDAGVGRMDDAFRLLDQALKQRTPSLYWRCSPQSPETIAFRRDPRWKPFLERLRRQVRLPPGTPDPYS